MSFRNTATSTLILATLIAAPAQAQDTAETPGEIVVTAQRQNQTEIISGGTVGVLGDKPAEDVPFTVRTFDESLIKNQQPLTLGEVLENDPTVRTAYGFGNAAEQFVIRGFELFGDDIGMNGLYGITPRQLVAPELYSGVQVLNGASAFLNGAAPGGTGIGGGVNLQLKRAGDTPLNRVTASYIAEGHIGASADFSRRFGDGGEFGVRVNGAYRDGEVSIDGEERRTAVVGGAFDYDGGNFRASVDLAYQNIRVDRLRPTVVTNVGIPEVPDADINYGQSYSFTDLESLFGVARVEYDVADNAMIYVAAGALESAEDGVYGDFTLSDRDTGDGSFGFASIIPAEQSNQAVEAGIRAKFGDTVTHEVNFGGNISWQEFRTAYDFRTGYASNLYAPQDGTLSPTPVFVGGDLDNPFPINTSRLSSAFASHTLGLWDERILLTSGLRLQLIKEEGYSYFGGGLTSAYEEDAVTPVVGIVVKPVDGVSLFANRIEGLQPGDIANPTSADPADPATVLPVTNAGQALSPYRSVQYEVGGKVSLGAVDASLALFDIDRPISGYDRDPDNPGNLLFSTFGTQRNRGVELFLSGEPVDGLRVIAGGSIIDAELQDTIEGVNEGNDAVGVPEYTANANIEWDLPFVPGLTLTGRVVHTGSQAANVSNSATLDDWTRVDLGTRYVVAAGEVPVTLRLTVDNVTDEEYWASSFSTFVSGDTARLLQGRPRTVRASVSVDF